MAQAAFIIPLVMGAMQAAGSMTAGNAASTAGKANARNQYQQAGTALDQSYVRAGQIADETSRRIAAQGAAYGASGVHGQTPLMVMADTAQRGEMARQLALYQGRIESVSAEQQGDSDTSQAAAAQQAGQFGAVTSLLGGAAKAYSATGGNIPTSG